MVIFRSIFSIFLSLNTQLTHLNASNLLNFDSLIRFLPIASQSWCSGVSKMATYIYISCRFICSKILGVEYWGWNIGGGILDVPSTYFVASILRKLCSCLFLS